MCDYSNDTTSAATFLRAKLQSNAEESSEPRRQAQERHGALRYLHRHANVTSMVHVCV